MIRTFAVASLLLVAAACAGGDTATSQVASTASTITILGTSTTTTTMPIPTTTAGPSAETIRASIRATLDLGTGTYEAELDQTSSFGDLIATQTGSYDLDAQILDMSFALSGSLWELLVATEIDSDVDLSSLHLILEGDTVLVSFIVDGEPRWQRVDTGQLATATGGLAAFDLPDSVAIPSWSWLLDAVLEDPSVVRSVELESEDAAWRGETVSRYVITVDQSVLAPVVVSSRQAPLVAAVDIEFGEPVPITWFVDAGGRFVGAQLDALDTFQRVVPALMEATTDLDASSAMGEFDAMQMTLSLGNLGLSVNIDRPDPAIVEDLVMDEVSGAELAVVAGDCFPSAVVAANPFATVTDRDCDIPHRVEVYAIATLDYDGEYPGEDPVFLYGSLMCSVLEAAYADGVEEEIIVLYPRRETWAAGDRIINCLYEFTESTVGSIRNQPETAVSPYALQPGMCFTMDTVFEDSWVDQVDCASPHTFEVIENFVLAWNDPFPGESDLADIAQSLCTDEFDTRGVGPLYEPYWLRPVELTWDYGDRTVTCLAESATPTNGALVSK